MLLVSYGPLAASIELSAQEERTGLRVRLGVFLQLFIYSTRPLAAICATPLRGAAAHTD